MSSELSFLDRLVEDLLKSKHNNYSEECINFYLDDALFTLEDITKVHNSAQERLKCSLIKHKPPQTHPIPHLNAKCIVYLHGFGSTRLQALFLAEQLPPEYCLCIFDMSGSGKSQGDKITYGLKEHLDIDPVLAYLRNAKDIREFVIWGRSMGAVAALLYATSQPRLAARTRRPRQPASAAQSMKSSMMLEADAEQEEPVIVGLVLDSPFCNFREIAMEIAQKKLSVPSFLLEVALNYVEESFGKILGQSIGEQFNPFRISLDRRISIAAPVVFLYSERDEIIAPSHSQRIIRNMASPYSKILINECTHNQTRPHSAIAQVFAALASYAKQERRSETDASVQPNRSLEKKRGICIYTPSKELKREQSPGPLKFYQAVTVELVRTEPMRSPRGRSSSKRSIVTLESSRKGKAGKAGQTGKAGQAGNAKEETATESSGGKHTLDVEMNRLLNSKLVEPHQEGRGLKMTRASKRFGYDKRREIRLSNEKYLK